MSTLWAFLAVSAIVIITPGPDTAVTIRNTLFGGRSGGVLTALGIAAGQAIWAFATSIGIVAALIAFEPLFLAIKYAGAAQAIEKAETRGFDFFSVYSGRDAFSARIVRQYTAVLAKLL